MTARPSATSTIGYEERFGCPLVQLWGMTGIAGVGTTFPADAARTTPQGEVGGLMIRGPIVMQGRRAGDERATRETIEPDGRLHSGDLASMDEDGAVFIVDRKKAMIDTATSRRKA